MCLSCESRNRNQSFETCLILRDILIQLGRSYCEQWP